MANKIKKPQQKKLHADEKVLNFYYTLLLTSLYREQQYTELSMRNKYLATANAKMSNLFVEITEKNEAIHKKNAEMEQKNIEFDKLNKALSKANANMSNLYLELEDYKTKLESQAKSLSKANANMSNLYVELEGYKSEIEKKNRDLLNANKEIKYINEITRTVNSTLDINAIVRDVMKAISQICHNDGFVIQLLSKDGKYLTVYKCSYGIERRAELQNFQISMESDESFSKRAIRENKIIYIRDVTQESNLSRSDKELLRLLEYKSIGFFPLEVQENIIGCVFIFCRQLAKAELTESNLDYLKSIIRNVATAINNSAIYNDLKRTKIELYESQQIIRLTNVFEKFVPKEFLSHLGQGGIEGIKIGSAIKVSISILFTDIRAFTSISESMEANKLLSFINDYFNSMQIEIYKNKGFIDKFIGDAIMALFEENDADDISNASHALDSAINMHWALNKFNNENPVAHENPLKIGTAIHTGDVILGTVGSENRINTTVLGDNVNLAARLEKMTKLYGSKILITQKTYDALTHKEKYLIRPLGRTFVRGRKEPITIYEVFNCDETDIVKLKIQTMGILQNAIELLEKNQVELALLEFNKILEINPNDTAIKCILNFLPRFSRLT